MTWGDRLSNIVRHKKKSVLVPVAALKRMSEYEPNSKRNSFQTDPNCRTCTDFKTWAKRQRSAMHMSSRVDTGDPGREAGEADPYSKQDNCPLDKDSLGRSTWGLLHTMSMTFPASPSDMHKQQMINMMHSLGHLYPCETCARDLRDMLVKEPPDVSSQDSLAQWLCRLHNNVNKKIGKPEFDCSKIYERWRDGWADGSCD